MLHQSLWCWPNIKPTFGECAVFAGKALPVNMRGGQLFLAPHCNTAVCFSTQRPSESIGEIIYCFLSIWIWKLDINATLGMKRL